ncbi:ComF family protein [Flavobacterium agrisoli]|uniref:ComF family protein n=1 Tax=Flavobacterium agrisoli TaxID=2793066 RepID=A0A934PJS7_9FLAO|nr:ComF family protein [Flavobacterium agrisoli]MBK0369431.1 ComF family protein [Flavobacterium agrisoli]
MLKQLLNLFFPPICCGCHGFLNENEVVICTHCRHEMPLTQHHLRKENEAFKTFYGTIDIQHASAFLSFHKKGIVQELIHQLKYKKQEEIGQVLGFWYAEDLKKVTPDIPFDTVIPVPLHPKKLKERGYNQVARFGKALAESLQLEYNDQILYRKTYAKTQSKKNRLDRQKGIKDAFDVYLRVENQNKHFILVDDVLTTGATLEACARSLLKIPGAKISVVCMAMATTN